MPRVSEKEENEKLNVKPVDAYVYHYGWVKEPGTMMKKAINANSFYQDKNLLKRAEIQKYKWQQRI